MKPEDHPILAKAIEKRNKAREDAAYWDRFILDYQVLEGNTVSAPARIAAALAAPAASQQLARRKASWADILRHAKKLIAEKGGFENAAALAEEMEHHGLIATKETVSQCLTHYRSAGEVAYDKDAGGWRDGQAGNAKQLQLAG